MKVGVLSLQGAFAEHLEALRRLNRDHRLAGHDEIEASEVRLPAELAAVDALIIPGGESTTIGKLMVEFGLLDPLRRRIREGMPVLGTCAGAIILARDLGAHRQPIIGAMDMLVRRNAFGRQVDSFEMDLDVPALHGPAVRAIFIRAPAITSVGPDVKVLARLPDGTIAAAQQGRLLATAFHPELTADSRLHAYFLQLAG